MIRRMPHPSDPIKLLIESNATEVVRLRQRIRETLASRDKSPKAREEWRRACATFHAHYDELAFPGGYTGALDRLVAGDPQTMEAAICFLELRPYFYRSGYMFDALIRKAKHAPLSAEQRARWEYVTERWRRWKELNRGKIEPLELQV
jgi:hypothetical protein